MLYDTHFRRQRLFFTEIRMAYFLFAFVLVVLPPSLLGCEGKGISLIGKDGERCPKCSDMCEGIFVDLTGECSCKSCATFGYDPDAGELLSCSARGVWVFRRECPGGVSVRCVEAQAHEVHCLDENGNEIPPP
jgi:hypothetical protein